MTALDNDLLGVHRLTKGGHGLHWGEWYGEVYAVMPVRGLGPPSSFTPFPYCIVAFSLPSLVSWL
jgi:hypothetical protein